MSRRVRVGVPPALTRVTPRSGHGKVWRSVLPELAERCRLVVTEPRRRRFRRAVDVWLVDGHQPAPPVDEPLVIQLHEAAWADATLRGLLDPGFLDAIERQTAATVAAATAVIVPSAAAKAQVVSLFPATDPARVHVAHHGVDHATFRPGMPGPAVDGPYVLFASQLHPRKNVDGMRAVMVGLAERGLPHKLVLVGGAPRDRSDGQALVDAARADLPGHPGRVVAFDDLTDAELAGLMAGADAFCLPSLMEGFGLTALEAMACGAPVVVSDRGALPEVVGDAAVVVPPDPGAIEHALAQLLSDPDRRAALGAAAHQRAATFTWSRAADGWFTAIEQAARAPAPVRSEATP